MEHFPRTEGRRCFAGDPGHDRGCRIEARKSPTRRPPLDWTDPAPWRYLRGSTKTTFFLARHVPSL